MRFTLILIIAEDIQDIEYEWKQSFKDWSQNYIVDWKHEYNNYIRSQYTDCNKDSNTRSMDEL